MENKLTYIKMLQFNLEYLIKCMKELEDITQSSSNLLKSRAKDIIDHPISSFLNDGSIHSLNWIVESTNSFLRFYPENVYKSGVQLLDDEMNRLYYIVGIINDEIAKGK